MSKILIFFFSVLIVFGCSKPNASHVKNIFIPEPKEETLKIGDLSNKMDYIVLETTQESMLGIVSKILFAENKVFIKSNDAVYIFDYSGKFLRKILAKGSAPFEYNSISDFDVDKSKNELLIFDKARKQILVFDFEGQYIRTRLLDFWAIRCVSTSSDGILFYSGNEITDNKKNTKFNLVAQDDKVEAFNSIDKRKSKYLHVLSTQNFYKNQNKLLFFEMFNDTLYTWDKFAGFIPKYSFSYNNNNIPTGFYDKSFANVMEFFQEFRKQNYAYGISAFAETDQLIFVSYYFNSKPCYAIFDKERNSADSFYGIQDNISFDNLDLPFEDEDFRIWTDNDSIIYLIQPDWLLHNKEKISVESKLTKLNKFSLDSNPIIAVAKLK